MKRLLLLAFIATLLTGCSTTKIEREVEPDVVKEKQDHYEEEVPEETETIAELDLPTESVKYTPFWYGNVEGEVTMFGDMEVTRVNSIGEDELAYVPERSEDLLYAEDILQAFADAGYYSHAIVEDFATFERVILFDEKTNFDCSIWVYECAMYGDDNDTAIAKANGEFEMYKSIVRGEVEGSSSIEYFNAEEHDNYVICNVGDDYSYRYIGVNKNLLLEESMFGEEANEEYNSMMKSLCGFTLDTFLSIGL